jgi:hypothetical protein
VILGEEHVDNKYGNGIPDFGLPREVDRLQATSF